MRAVDVQVLEGARERVARGWWQTSFAATRDGRVVPPHHSDAARWCLAGALHVAASQRGHTDSSGNLTRGYEPELEALHTTLRVQPDLRALCDTLPEPPSRPMSKDYLRAWNDQSGRTKEQVLALFDRTIRTIHTLSGESGR